MTDDVRGRLEAILPRGATDVLLADPSLLIVAKPRCKHGCDDGWIVIGDGDYEGAEAHEEPCGYCDRGYQPMTALPTEVVKEWAAVRLAQETAP